LAISPNFCDFHQISAIFTSFRWFSPIFGDFYQFSAEQLVFFLQTSAMITFWVKIISLFANLLGENHNIGPPMAANASFLRHSVISLEFFKGILCLDRGRFEALTKRRDYFMYLRISDTKCGGFGSGWPNWANFRLLGDCLLWSVF
jgi:hypothetical protein